MKIASKKIFVILSIVILSNICYSQKKIHVSLYVDTVNFNPKQIEDHCVFIVQYSERTRSYDSKLKDFLVLADIGDEIIWNGVSLSDYRFININKIKRESDTQIFDKDSISGKIYGSLKNKIVKGEVIKDTVGKDDYKYTIYFEINGKVYPIDPKIRVGSTRNPFPKN